MAALAEAQREAQRVRAAHTAEALRWEALEAEGRRAAAAERRLQREVDAMSRHEARMQAHLLELEEELALRTGLQRPDAAAEGSTSASAAPSTPPSKANAGRRAHIVGRG